MPKLTDHFSLEEMTFSETAARHDIANVPDADSRKNLLELCENMLEPIRNMTGGPITVTSGYRSPVLNSLIAGAADSQHKTGEAADINCPLFNPQALFQRIRQSGLPFDQLIDEFGTWVHVSYRKPGRNAAASPRAAAACRSWVHVSYRKPGRNRRQVLRARKVDGVTKYTEL